MLSLRCGVVTAGLLALLSAPGAASERVFVSNEYFTFGDPDGRTAAIELADVDGDGDLDAFTANGRHWAQQDYVYFNNGAGRMLTALPVGDELATAYRPAIADLDGDGDLDIVSLRDRVRGRLFFNDGAGRFRPAGAFGLSGPARSASVADLDRDGRPDVIVAQRSGRSYVVYDVGGPGERVVQVDRETQSVRATVADFNADGYPDAAFANIDEVGSYVMLNDGAGALREGIDLGPDTAGSIEVVAVDLDGDGDQDLVLGSWDRANRLVLNDGSAGFSGMRAYGLAEERTFGLAAADLDADGRIDIVVANYGQPNAVYLAEGGLSFRRVVLSEDPEGMSYGVSLGDLNGDGTPDLVFANSGAMNRIHLNVDPGGEEAVLAR